MSKFDKNPTVVDVTIRDGGYLNGWKFETETIVNMAKQLSQVGVDVIEVGYLHSDTNKPLALQCPKDYLELMRNTMRPETKLGVMLRSDDEHYQSMLEQTAEYIDLIRIACTEDAFDEELEMAVNVRKFNIPCSINFTSITSFTPDEVLEMLNKVIQKDCADMLYIADSRGTLRPEPAADLFALLRSNWDKHLGFHGHNNQGFAIPNVQAALNNGADFIDGAIKGYGFGGGNTQLLQLIDVLKDIRPDIQVGDVDVNNLMHLDNNPEYAFLFPYSGQKNLEQNWAEMIWDKYGDDSLDFIKSLPDNKLNKQLSDVGI